MGHAKILLFYIAIELLYLSWALSQAHLIFWAVQPNRLSGYSPQQLFQKAQSTTVWKSRSPTKRTLYLLAVS